VKLVGADPVRTRTATQDRRTGRDPLDPEPGEILEPAVEAGREGERVGSELGAQPFAGVCERVVRAVVQQPGVATRGSRPRSAAASTSRRPASPPS
jgi:hypothetical protein